MEKTSVRITLSRERLSETLNTRESGSRQMGAQCRHASGVENNITKVTTHKVTPFCTYRTSVVTDIELRVHTGLRTQDCLISSVKCTSTAVREVADESRG